MVHRVQREIGGRTLTLETGRLAGQAHGAVTVSIDDTVALVTVCMSSPREGIDFFPLTVEYEERMYAAGKIPGSFFRREGRPSTVATLAARLTDRPIRPLFPKGFHNEVQIICTILSTDREFPPDIFSLIGASAALSISQIPFDGPIGGCRIGYVDGEMVVNPTYAQIDEAALELVIASTKDAVVMVEAGATELPEKLVLEAMQRGHAVNQEIIEAVQELARVAGAPKIEVTPPQPPSVEVEDGVKAALDGRLTEAIFSGKEKGERDAEIDVLFRDALKPLEEQLPREQVAAAFQELINQEFRSGVLIRGIRPDGRGTREVRPITSEVGILPRTHGSGLFTRGQTQILSTVTLGSPGDKQRLDNLSPEETKRFMHHYNFPPYSVGEVRRIGGAGRREVGHGALAERALEPVIPGPEEFPYTVRLVSEALSSNGSTSMGSICGSTLALMDAGVPIKAPVAGVAMGLIMGEDGNYTVLTDIQGLEDHIGDMDFKVAGTGQGVTALQMDIKVKGVTFQIMETALEQAREARLHILDKMREAIPEVRATMSPYAPKIVRIKIPVEKIGAVIGPGGKTIRAIVEETKASVDVENDGTVVIASPNGESLRLAQERIENLTRDVEVGSIYTGKVSRITSFGAFVEILPGKDGLVRLNELSDQSIERVEEEVEIGDEVTVMVIEIDPMGRINLSRRAVLQGVSPAEVSALSQRSSQGSGGPRSGPGGPGRPFGLRPSGPPRSGDRRPDPRMGNPRPGFQRGPGGGPPGERR